MKQITKDRIRTFQAPRKVFKLLEKIRSRAANREESQTTGKKSVILDEGSKRLSESSFFKRIFYTTWNTIPIRYTIPIARELLKTLSKIVISKLKGRNIAETLDLRPNYPQVKMAPLEMSFTRRSRGVLNWFRDIFTGKPYRLLSDIKDGILYSPKGGSLSGIFPKTMSRMVDDPATQSILKLNRIAYLEQLGFEYQGYPDPDSMSMDELYAGLRKTGKSNTLMLYMLGFRDSQIETLEEKIRNSLGGSESSERLLSAIREKKHNLTRHSGFSGDYEPEFKTGILEQGYEFRDFEEVLENNNIDLPHQTRKKVHKLFRLREELVEEAGKTVEPAEYCRSTMYRLARELGSRFVSQNKLRESSDIFFLTIYEVSDLMKKGVADQGAIERRRTKVNEMLAGVQ